jgi:membrane complex biogenesis BtpA family protein
VHINRAGYHSFRELLRAVASCDSLPMLFGDKALIGVIHLPALPGAPRAARTLAELREGVARDASALAAAGFDAVLIENFGDAPFLKGPVGPETVACMTALAEVARVESGLPLGVNVLRNDAVSALAVAVATSARFIRVNVLVGARVTDQGIIEGVAAELLRARRAFGAQDVKIIADVDVKHSAPLGESSLTRTLDEARDAVHRAFADALVVTGAHTGGAPDETQLAALREALPHTPLWIGSGVREDTLTGWLQRADAVIVGSALRVDGRAGGPIDAARAASFARARGPR